MILLALMLGVLSPAPGRARAEDPASERKAEAPKSASWTLDEIFAAIRLVETGGTKKGGRDAVGDGGKAIGPYQIQRPYWIDSKIPGKFEDCRDAAYSRKVMIAYWRRYCPKALEALDAQSLARVHNGGPDGHKENSTKVFWRKVERELAKGREAAQRKRPGRRPVLVQGAISIESSA